MARYPVLPKGPSSVRSLSKRLRGGPLALVQNGDTVEIDIPNRKLNLLISQAELEERRRKGKASPPARPEVRSTNGGEIREENGNTPG